MDIWWIHLCPIIIFVGDGSLCIARCGERSKWITPKSRCWWLRSEYGAQFYIRAYFDKSLQASREASLSSGYEGAIWRVWGTYDSLSNGEPVGATSSLPTIFSFKLEQWLLSTKLGWAKALTVWCPGENMMYLCHGMKRKPISTCIPSRYSFLIQDILFWELAELIGKEYPY